MKLQLLILFLFIYDCHGLVLRKKERLNRVYERLWQRSKKLVGVDVDQNCVKNLFKLDQNSNMLLWPVESKIFQAAAFLKCTDESRAFNYYYKSELVQRGHGSEAYCLKWHLRNYEPESKFLNNFEITDEELESCKEIQLKEEIVIMQGMLEDYLGPLDAYTCGVVSNGAEEYIKAIAKATLLNQISYSDYDYDDEEKEDEELVKLRNRFVNVTMGTVDCLLKRYEANPAAFLVNDSLATFFNKEVPSTNSRIQKLEEAIDQDCVKEKLNLPENGHKALLETEAGILIASAKSQCIKGDQVEFSNIFIDLALSCCKVWANFLACSKHRLKNLEPGSKLINISDLDQMYATPCRSFDPEIRIYKKLYEDYHEFVGPVDQNTCGVITYDVMRLVTYKTVLISVQTDEELKVKETKDLFNYTTDKLHKLAECILDRIK